MTDQPLAPLLDTVQSNRVRLDAIAKALKVKREFFDQPEAGLALRPMPDPQAIADFAYTQFGQQLVELLSDIKDPAIQRLAVELVLTVGALKASSQ